MSDEQLIELTGVGRLAAEYFIYGFLTCLFIGLIIFIVASWRE